MDSEPHGQSSPQGEHVWVLALVLPLSCLWTSGDCFTSDLLPQFLICKSRARAVLASSHVERGVFMFMKGREAQCRYLGRESWSLLAVSSFHAGLWSHGLLDIPQGV